MTSEMQKQESSIATPGIHPGSMEASLEGLRRALSVGETEAARSRFIAAIDRALLDTAAAPKDVHWHLHDLALVCDRAGATLLARERLELGVDLLRRGLAIREQLARLTITDPLFADTVEVSVELAASYFAIAHAYQRAGRAAAALAEMQLGIAAYRREIESGGDPCALDTLAAHLEDAGRIARDVPDRNTMRALIAESLGLRERAARLAPEDPDLARAFVEACVWRTPDLGKKSAMWLDRARRLLAERESSSHPIPGTGRLRNLVDTAGAPYLSG